MFMTKIQFERPFLYSTGTWVQGGCEKNLTQIVPSQPMYEEYGQPVEKPEKRREEGKFVYQILSKGALPHIKFHIPGKLKCIHIYGNQKKGIVQVTVHNVNSFTEFLASMSFSKSMTLSCCTD